MVYLGELGEQKKRRFVVYLLKHAPICVECDDYNWCASGLVFYGSKQGESWNCFTVYATTPSELCSFYELADCDDWPSDITPLFSEQGMMSRTSQGWIKCNPTR